LGIFLENRAVNPNEHDLQYPEGDRIPPLGQALALRPGVHWLRMPLPFALDHINLWLLEDEIDGRAGFTAIDCGVASDAAKAAWEALFDTVFDGLPLLRVIATHFHPDHLGLAQWLCDGGERRRWQAPLWMTATEYGYGRFLSQPGADHAAGGEDAAAHFGRHGLTDPAALEQVRARARGYYSRLVPAVPRAYRRIRDGELLHIGRSTQRRAFRVMVGQGHSPEHASLHCESDGLLIGGDMVLPRISTNVGVFDLEPEADPLPLYLQSLDRLRPLAADTLVLPSHGKPFVGLHARIDQQHNHHGQRLQEVLQACITPQSAAQVVPVLFKRELDLHQLTFALGESLAHLHALWFAGRLRRELQGDGVFRFMVP
jgi:glyoxylase-like metal-dependent hydrolase (beta-lactamase superfamily II)